MEIHTYLKSIQKQVSEIDDKLAESGCCILNAIGSLQRLVAETQILHHHFILRHICRRTCRTSQRSLWRHVACLKDATGALIVVEREQPAETVLSNGIPVSGLLSATLIETIFYPENPLHDGGMLIKNNVIVSAGNILPLSNRQETGEDKLGTRHRAALGLSERVDALVIVVSEETGRISFALEGSLYADRSG
ncbi:DNA integrity scanning protein DisA nucleotide-binding domain protein [Bacillus sp. T33-2]|uniref:DNA integrity scanning protein DisA nucleotide-binding domain protein n=1 Tax=Bacillus sp. T33-2 TaxID=2054168 RepID=UPI0021555FCE|nr:DNA integrity scanning protein DisA nucleotide-binding domain protein [Bacillus sp. T33-2]